MIRPACFVWWLASLALFPLVSSSDELQSISDGTLASANGSALAMSTRADLIPPRTFSEQSSQSKAGSDAAAEAQDLKDEIDLLRTKADRELAQQRIEIEKARVEADAIYARVELESARLQSRDQEELAALRAAKQKADLEAQLAESEFLRRSNLYKAQEISWNVRLAELKAKVAEREQELAAESYVEQRPVYLKDPLTPEGELIISDRRIPLNGVISLDTAEFVCSRIDFFNNKSKEYPIFLVIDDSPGGSVMAGYKILRSMQSSKAPVCVVVKSFAASMAAAICTLAPRSFAYPNAIILHHQISNGVQGNLTQQRERVKMLEEWWSRLAAPIAEKMGVSMEDFAKQMYEHSSSGDWQEFGDEAVKLKWVDAVVSRCQETAFVKDPDIEADGVEVASATGRAQHPHHSERTDAVSLTTNATLPRLNPVDCYYLYNPDGFYQSN